MKAFDQHQFDRRECLSELTEFAELLQSRDSLSESADILPFLRQRRHLVALVGIYSSEIVRGDLLAFEFDLFGDFVCDLAIGDSRKNAYLLVEFEGGGPESVFVNRGRSTPEWSSRFDDGFSQIIDWLYKLADMRHTAAFEQRFGSRAANFTTLLVVGRRSALGEREQARLEWRRQKVVVDSNHIYCSTYDDLLDDLRFRLAVDEEA